MPLGTLVDNTQLRSAAEKVGQGVLWLTQGSHLTPTKPLSGHAHKIIRAETEPHDNIISVRSLVADEADTQSPRILLCFLIATTIQPTMLQKRLSHPMDMLLERPRP